MGILCCKEDSVDLAAEVELSHFNLLRSVGKGAFGKVRVVQNKGTNIMYALKYINKDKCIKMKATDNIIQERKLLEIIDHPFVCNLRYAFQDDENLFMVLDLMLGGDLRFHLEKQGSFKEHVVKFFIAEAACCITYLHSKRIVHRDLKPDNILLDEYGHVHLTDFNIAVQYKEEKNLHAVAGSMAYMAPEILLKKGYQSSVDWWSLGVVMYELLFGKRPFSGRTNDIMTKAILHDHIIYPENASKIVSKECLSCLKGFLSRDIRKRLGTKGTGGFDSLKKHEWFKHIEWDQLETKKISSPFVPDCKKANFDATHELEEILLEDNPLRFKARKRKKNGELEERQAKPGEDPAIIRDLKIMEEKFTVYDFTKPVPKKEILSSIMSFPCTDTPGINRHETKVSGNESINREYTVSLNSAVITHQSGSNHRNSPSDAMTQDFLPSSVISVADSAIPEQIISVSVNTNEGIKSVYGHVPQNPQELDNHISPLHRDNGLESKEIRAERVVKAVSDDGHRLESEILTTSS